jgi:hypothetical protein
MQSGKYTIQNLKLRNHLLEEAESSANISFDL